MNLRDWWVRLVALPSAGARQDYWHLEQEEAEMKREELRKRLLRAEADVLRKSHEGDR